MVDKALKIKILLNVVKKDIEDVLDPQSNREKIYDMSIMNVEMRRDKKFDINHMAHDIVQLTMEWIKKLFKLELVPHAIPLQAKIHLVKGKVSKVIVSTFLA